ncbi:MAG: CYTH domain-containing protein [Sedimentisphaerales bacterium]
MISNEIEYKLSSLANIQFKFTKIESGNHMQRKLNVLCDAVDINLGAQENKEIYDDYYDDVNGTLKNAGISFRYRKKIGSGNVVTLKIVNSTKLEKGGAHNRKEDEFDCSDVEFDELKNNAPKLSARILTNFKSDLTIGTLIHVLSIKNERTSFKINTGVAEYEICFDKYYYRNPVDNSYSEIFGEVEIELEGKAQPPFDKKLDKLKILLTDIFDYTPNPSTKLGRGLKWKKNPTESTSVFTLAFDIVGFSKETADVQKRNIMNLNYFASLAVKQNRPDDDEKVIYLPTGDGMLMVFEGRPETLIPIVKFIHNEVSLLAKNSPDKSFLFRTGIHCGEAFKYSDVNGNLNFAGGGINMAVRVMDKCHPWQILASENAYHAIGETIAVQKRFFHLHGEETVKHGVKMILYNIFDVGAGFGIESPPR